MDLDTSHCTEILDTELNIGSDTAINGKRKRFGFHVLTDEYRVTLDGEIIDSGQAVEELLEVYNDL